MGTMCVEIAHGFLPCTRRVLIRHGQHLIDERGHGPGLFGLFLRSDWENSACGVVAGDTPRRRRAGLTPQSGFLNCVYVGSLIEHTHCPAPSLEIATICLIVRDPALAGKFTQSAAPAGRELPGLTGHMPYGWSPWIDSSGEDGSKPLGDRFLEMTQLPVIENGYLAIGDIQVAVVVNQDMR